MSSVPLSSSFPVVQVIVVHRLGSSLSGYSLWACPSVHGVLVDRGVGLGRGVVSWRTAVGLTAVIAVSVVHRAVVIIQSWNRTQTWWVLTSISESRDTTLQYTHWWDQTMLMSTGRTRRDADHRADIFFPKSWWFVFECRPRPQLNSETPERLLVCVKRSDLSLKTTDFLIGDEIGDDGVTIWYKERGEFMGS